jgi:hypothetical protein
MFVSSHHQNGCKREAKCDGSKEQKQGIRAPTLLHGALPVEMHILGSIQCARIITNYTRLHCSKYSLKKEKETLPR